MPEGALSILPPSEACYRCQTCTADLTLSDELTSRSFNALSGPAFLFRNVLVSLCSLFSLSGSVKGAD